MPTHGDDGAPPHPASDPRKVVSNGGRSSWSAEDRQFFILLAICLLAIPVIWGLAFYFARAWLGW